MTTKIVHQKGKVRIGQHYIRPNFVSMDEDDYRVQRALLGVRGSKENFYAWVCAFIAVIVVLVVVK